MRKCLIITGASVLALSSGSAFAQAAGQAADHTEARDSADIVVTATRSNSLLSKTPIAMTAITGEDLRSKGIASPTQLGNDVPNVAITRGLGLQITIRGVSSTDASEKGDPSAAFLLDGIYIARPQEADVSFFDVSRVEVLRGPQGTLYGRNTTAGLVNVITNKPEIGRFSLAANAGYGNYNAFNADGHVNIPVSDTFALRASASFDRRDNYLSSNPAHPINLDPFRKNLALRLQAFWQPSDAFSILLRGGYEKLDGSRLANSRLAVFYDATARDAQGRAVWIADRLSTRQQLTIPTIILPSGAPALGIGDVRTTDPSVNNHAWNIDGEVNWSMGGARITYLGSYRRYVSNENQPLDVGAPVTFTSAFNGRYEQQSHELRVATDGTGPLKAQAGLYYFREQSGIALLLPGVPFAPTPIFGFPQDPTISSSKAVYGQATYSLAPAVRFTVGGRYTDDGKSRFGHTIFQQTLTFNPAAGDFKLLNAADIVGNIKHTKFTWRVGVDADVAGGLAYASVATGYKAGGFGDGCLAGVTTRGELCNQPRDPRILFYQPETLTAYEAGYKARFSSAVRAEIAVFHYDYNNLQLTQLANVSGAPSAVTLNGGKAEITGVEASVTLSPSPRNRIDLGYTYTDAHYSKYCPLDDVTSTAPVGANGCIGNGISFAGKPLDRTPKNVVTVGYAYTLPIGAGSLVSSVRSRLSSEYVLTDFGTATQYRNPSYTRTDLSLTYNAPGDRFYVQGYVQNLEDAIRLQNLDSFGNATPTDPRTFGVRAGVRF